MINPIDLVASVAILVLTIIPGFLLSKFHLTDGRFALGLSNFVLYVAQSCMFIRAFANTPFSTSVLLNMLLTFICSVIIHLLFTLIAYLFYRSSPDGLKRILRFSTVFTNAGYMSIALFQLLYPGITEVTLYASVYLIFFNMYAWSVGVMIHTKDKSYIRARHMFLNPAIISTAIGLVLFFCHASNWINSNSVTAILNRTIGILADTVCPLSMIVVGTRLGMMSFRGFLRDRYLYEYLFVRLLLSPALVWCLMRPLILLLTPWIGENAATMLLSVLLVCASTPAATNGVMFAERYNTDAGYAGKLVAVSTILSVVTMPICSLLLLI